MRTIVGIMALVAGIYMCGVTACPKCSIKDCSCMTSYDTTYVENGAKYRQVYVNDGKSETFILTRNDSVIVRDTIKF